MEMLDGADCSGVGNQTSKGNSGQLNRLKFANIDRIREENAHATQGSNQRLMSIAMIHAKWKIRYQIRNFLTPWMQRNKRKLLHP